MKRTLDTQITFYGIHATIFCRIGKKLMKSSNTNIRSLGSYCVTLHVYLLNLLSGNLFELSITLATGKEYCSVRNFIICLSTKHQKFTYRKDGEFCPYSYLSLFSNNCVTRPLLLLDFKNRLGKQTPITLITNPFDSN